MTWTEAKYGIQTDGDAMRLPEFPKDCFVWGFFDQEELLWQDSAPFDASDAMKSRDDWEVLEGAIFPPPPKGFNLGVRPMLR